MRWVSVLGCICGLLLGLATMGIAEEEIRLTNGEWPPFTSKTLKHYGVYSHIVSEAFALEGVKVEYGFFPWPRAYHYVKKGEWDGSVTWAPTLEKEKDVWFSDPVFYHTKVFFHRKQFSFDWNTLQDLKDLPIGATAQYTYGHEFDQAAKDGTLIVDYATRDIQNFRKLLAGRFLLFASDIDVGYDLLKKYFSPEESVLVTHHAKPIQQTGTCVIFNKGAPDKSQRLLGLFNRGLKKLRQNGAYDQMLDASRRGAYHQN
jgi:polar amino acid transport system substrate-binding protein